MGCKNFIALDREGIADYEFPMTQNAIFSPSQSPLTIAFLVLPQASILELASALDPLRSANRHLGSEAYLWRVVSRDGAPVPLTCGVSLPADGPLAAAKGADALIVVAGYRLAEAATRQLLQDLRRLSGQFALIGGIDSGPWVLARAGLLNGYRATVHWEDLEDLAAAHPEIEVLPDRFVIDRNRVTIGGAAPALDFMLHLIRARHGAPLARQVANSFVTRAQPAQEPQIAAPRQDRSLDPRLARAVTRMEARIEQPETAQETARALGLSPRQLEKLFAAGLGTSPAAYALSLRLQAARRLLSDTNHPLTEIALRTGFSSPATLSRAFSRSFGQAPGAFRRKLR